VNLKLLYCYRNKFTELKGLDKLVNLESSSGVASYTGKIKTIELSSERLEGVLDIARYCLDNNINAEKVKELKCHNNELTELKGLDKLVNLEVLWCSNNKLTKLDLSNLINLEWLDCSYNKLTELDVSKLVNLKGLYCSYNKLTELDVSKLVNLKGLDCSFNKLTELDVSKLVNLQSLWSYNSKLVKLDVTNLVNLHWLNGGKYPNPEFEPEPEPEQNKLDLLTNRVEKLEQIISELTKGKQCK